MQKWTSRIETPIKAELICYDVNGIHIVFGVTEENQLKLFHFSHAPFDAENLCRKPDNWWPMEGMREAQIKESFQLVQVNFSGYNRPYEKHGNKYIVTAPGFMLKFDSISEERNENGDVLRIVQKDTVTGAKVESVMQFFDGIPVARMYNTVTNEGKEDQTLEYISSFSYWGIEKEHKAGIPEFISSDDKMSMVVVHNGWQKELTVKKYHLRILAWRRRSRIIIRGLRRRLRLRIRVTGRRRSIFRWGILGTVRRIRVCFLRLITVVPGIMRLGIRTAISI